MSLYDLTAETIDHSEQPLSAYQGKVLLVVNTASECGSTPQYAGLEALWRAYRGRGFAVLGFPSNDCGGQEPGTEAEIKTVCDANYKVTFPLYAKPKWNFHKYLVGKDGQVIRAFPTAVEPDDPALRSAIEAALA